jgi:hypothetical protein
LVRERSVIDFLFLFLLVTVSTGGCKGRQTYTTVSGSLYGGTLSNMTEPLCEFLIATSQILCLSFLEFDLGNSIMKVYDGSSSFGKVLGVFTGDPIPSPLFANSGSMLIVVSRDYKLPIRWRAQWVSGMRGAASHHLSSSSLAGTFKLLK